MLKASAEDKDLIFRPPKLDDVAPSSNELAMAEEAAAGVSSTAAAAAASPGSSSSDAPFCIRKRKRVDGLDDEEKEGSDSESDEANRESADGAPIAEEDAAPAEMEMAAAAGAIEQSVDEAEDMELE